jgi:dephospho-CoA kinase
MNIPTTYVSMDRLVHDIYANPQYDYIIQEIAEQIGEDIVDEN